MHWKTYRDLPPEKKHDETYYIIGLDIGNESTGIAFYNLNENAPEVIDLSGGYGKPSIPTVIQYIPETKEWVFGEYAILNQGAGTEITLSNLLSSLGHREYYEVDGKTIRHTSILALFIKEVIGNVRNINPKAEIVGIIAAIPDRLSNEAQLELRQAFQLAGYEKELLALVPSRECVLAHHYRNCHPAEGKVLLLDYGSSCVRSGVYELRNDGVTALSNIFNDEIGTGNLLDDVNVFFRELFGGETTSGFEQQLSAFTYQHKDLLFQKNIRTKPVKLYYNFVYPPFQQTVTHNYVQQLVAPYSQNFDRLISDALGKNTTERRIAPRDIDAVLCIGGGFEMLWAREAVEDVFALSQIHMYKNPKLVTAEGAAQTAARILGVATGQSYMVEDDHQLLGDIGIKSGDAFLPLALGESYWWQVHEPKLVLVNGKVSGELELFITQRMKEGHEITLASPLLSGLPPRPKGTTRLKFGVEFISNKRMKIKVSDLGFGELFPRSEYQEEFVVNIA
ncbi:MAG: DUF5716 family protein [Defluviitaleaceae bacterium]|nr:DUF5716 family protein [Defluviitaleaceae bacterium]